MSSQHDKSLLCQLKQGDTHAFEQIYHLYKQPLFHFALRYLKDQALAEDALQELFVKLWNRRLQLDENASLKAFLYQCLKNHVLNVIRTEQNRIKYAALALREKNTIVNTTQETLDYQESQQLIHKGMEALSSSKQHIFQLKIMEGYSNQEIAEKLGISEHTVRSQLSQSHKLIRKFLNKVMSLMLSLGFFC